MVSLDEWCRQNGLTYISHSNKYNGRNPFRDDRNQSFVIFVGKGKNIVAYDSAYPERTKLYTEQVIASIDKESIGKFVGDQANAKNEAERIAEALRWWERARPWQDSPILPYLESRGLKPDLNDHIRYSSDKYRPGYKGWLVMRALTLDDNHLATFGKAIDLKKGGKWDRDRFKAKALGIKQGVVRLYPWAETMGIAEGVETAWSVTAMTGLPCLTCHGVGFDKAQFPNLVRRVIIFGDNGDAGERAATKGVASYNSRGLDAQCILPAKPGDDFNDVWQAQLRSKQI